VLRTHIVKKLELPQIKKLNHVNIYDTCIVLLSMKWILKKRTQCRFLILSYEGFMINLVYYIWSKSEGFKKVKLIWLNRLASDPYKEYKYFPATCVGKYVPTNHCVETKRTRRVCEGDYYIYKKECKFSMIFQLLRVHQSKGIAY